MRGRCGEIIDKKSLLLKIFIITYHCLRNLVYPQKDANTEELKVNIFALEFLFVHLFAALNLKMHFTIY